MARADACAQGVPVKKVLLIQSNHFDAGYTAEHEPLFYGDGTGMSGRFSGKLASVLSLYFTR